MLLVFEIVFSAPIISRIESIGGRQVGGVRLGSRVGVVMGGIENFLSWY